DASPRAHRSDQFAAAFLDSAFLPMIAIQNASTLSQSRPGLALHRIRFDRVWVTARSRARRKLRSPSGLPALPPRAFQTRASSVQLTLILECSINAETSPMMHCPEAGIVIHATSPWQLSGRPTPGPEALQARRAAASRISTTESTSSTEASI